MPFSQHKLFKIYCSTPNIPCKLSRSCFARIWKEYFKKLYYKARQRDGLCQLCEIGHKLEKLEELQQTFHQYSPLSTLEKKQFQDKKTSSRDTK